MLPVGWLLYTLFLGFLSAGNYAGEEAKDLIFIRGIMLGKGIYRDMDWMYGPLYPHLMALFFRATDRALEVLTLRHFAVAAGSIGFIGAYLAARRFLSPVRSGLVAFASCTIFLPPNPTYNHHGAAASALLGTALLMGQAEIPRAFRIVLLALLTSVSLLMKPLPMGVAQFMSTLLVLLWLGATTQAHRTRSATWYVGLVAAVSGTAYGFIFGQEGIRQVLEQMRPIAFQGENLSFHFLSPFLHPESLVQAWSWIVTGPRSGGSLLMAFDHLSYTLDFLAVLAGAWTTLRLYRAGNRSEAVALGILTLTAYAIDSEVIVFGRELLFSGIRAPAILLLLILAFRASGAGMRETEGRPPDRKWSRWFPVLLAGFTQLRIVLLRAVPMMATLIDPDPSGPISERFAAQLEIPGFRGVRVMPETKVHFDIVASEIGNRLSPGKTAASWGVPGFVTFLLGERNILWLGVNRPSPGVLQRSKPDDRPDYVFLQEILPLTTPDGCNYDLWPQSVDLGYRRSFDHCGKVSRSYFSLFSAYERLER